MRLRNDKQAAARQTLPRIGQPAASLKRQYGRQARRNDRQGHAGKSACRRSRANHRRHYKQLGASGSAGGRKRQGRESYSYWDNGLVLWRVLEVGALYFAYHLNNAECLSSIRIRK